MIYKLVLGDWSEDGHGISEDFLFECNYDVHKIRQAYKDSCRKLGVTFNYNEDYTGLGLGYGSERQDAQRTVPCRYGFLECSARYCSLDGS